MEAPDKIYVPQHNIEAGNIQELDELIVAGSTEYLRKDAVVSIIKDYLANWLDSYRIERLIDKMEEL